MPASDPLLPPPPADTRPAPASTVATPTHHRRKMPPAIKWVIVLLVAIGAFAYWRAKTQDPAGEKHRHSEDGPIPVVTAKAEAQNFPLYLDGLGTVQAYNSVLVRARVDGEIDQILFQEGQDVKKGDLLVQIDPRTYQAQVDQAKAKMAQDQAQLNNAKASLARNQMLIKNSVIDQQTFDTQRYSVDQLQALVAADQAALDNSQTLLDYTRITAPISGRAGIRQVDAGNIVRAADAGGIVVINQVQPISVVFTLPQQQLKEAREALLKDKNLKVQALERDNLSVLSNGTLEVLDNQIDATTATVKLKAIFTNEDLKLWPGQFVNVRLMLGEKDGAIVVPAAAVQRGPKGTYIYVVIDGKAQMKDVDVGATEDDRVMINSGIQAGDEVVVDGQYRLQPNSEVTTGTDHGTPSKRSSAAKP